MTQEQRVLRHLKMFGSITSWEAIQEYGITRLSAKIYNLRNIGYDITNKTEHTKNRYGEKVAYARYTLKA